MFCALRHLLPLSKLSSSHWKWPNINGLTTFKGDLVHTADWKDDIDLRGKKVGVIGNGSSGMQVLAAIYPGNIMQHSYIYVVKTD